MSASPKAQVVDNRSDVPSYNLDDDRRGQSISFPSVVMSHNITLPASRPGTMPNAEDGNERMPNFAAVDHLLRPDMVTRDFGESAIIDDEADLSPGVWPRHGSISASPSGVRRNTFLRPRDVDVVRAPRSRAASSSSSSSSEPNSVDAFADNRRRGRAGTVTSRAGSELDLALHRTVSGGTGRRRPTFSNDDRPLHAKTADDAVSTHSSHSSINVSDKNGKTFKIDYEELEEFLVKYENKMQTPNPPKLGATRRLSTASSMKPRIFDDLRTQSQSIPQIITHDSNFDEKDLSGLDKAGDANVLRRPPSARSVTITPQIRWTLYSSEMEDVITARELGDLLMPGETFRDLFEPSLSRDEGLWWLDIKNPTKEEIEAICHAFNVHPLTMEDIVDQETREKFEVFNGYYFVNFRSFWQADETHEDYLDPVNIYVVVFPEGTLSFSFETNPHASDVLKRIRRYHNHMRLTSDWLCYALIDSIVDNFVPVLKQVEDRAESIEDDVYRVREADDNAAQILKAIGDTRKKIITLTRLIGEKLDVIKAFRKRTTHSDHNSSAPRQESDIWISDIEDHVKTMKENLNHFESMLSRGHQNYLTMIQMYAVSQGNHINETLGKVTMIATILVPLNLICGLFGMNVPVPGAESGTLAWFFGILGIILLFVITCVIVARRKKLI